MTEQKNTDSVIAYLAATAPALLQLIAVTSVGFVNVLRLDKFVLDPEFINIANFLVILLSISIITLASFWDYNVFALLQPAENIFNQTKKYWKILKISCVVSVIGFFTFMAIILNKPSIFAYIEIFTFIQWASYIISMTSMSFIIYSYVLLKIQERKSKDLRENYIPRLIDSLRRYGHVKSPDIIILSVDKQTNTAIVKLGGNTKFSVTTDYDGTMTSIEAVRNTNN